jgi:DNA-binding NarL/FixJ family response regulator
MKRKLQVTEKPTCFIADDHPAILEAVMTAVAKAGYEVIGSARDGEEALEKIRNTKPNLVILDVKMPRLSGIELARILSREMPAVNLVFYTAYGDRALLSESLDAGAKGFLLKEAPLTDLIRALDTVCDDKIYVDSILAGVLAASESDLPVRQLTKREREVLRLLADGMTNEQIGKALFISPETVRTHVRKAMVKLGAENRVKAVALALRSEIIS